VLDSVFVLFNYISLSHELSCLPYLLPICFYLQVAQEFLDFISGKRPEGTKLIVSSHNYEFTPSNEDLGSLVARIQAVGADIVKIATFAVDICDVARMFQVLVHCQVTYTQQIDTNIRDLSLDSKSLGTFILYFLNGCIFM